MAEPRRGVAPLCLGVFVVLLGSYAFYWQARDWSTASRLMLVYAMGDRATIRLNGLERQTGDIAFDKGSFYTDKQPGYSAMGVPIYLAAKQAFGFESHPLGREGFAHWPADYWVTLGVSGIATAWCGALLTWLASWLGCGPRRAVLVGLGYGLATPAYAYATLAYGHNVSASMLLTSLALIATRSKAKPPGAWPAIAAGFFASAAATVELSLGPISAILGLWFAARAVRHGGAGWAALGLFGIGVLGPALGLMAYNLLAFGSPFDMGYAHLIMPRFREVHSESNPLGLTVPRWDRLAPLFVGDYRGLFFYAPVVALAPLGWWRLGRAGQAGVAGVSALATALVFWVNLSYPEWTGGWTTGPRLLVPCLPFAAVGVAGFLAGEASGRWRFWLTAALILAGWVVVQLFVGVGGRVPETITHPLAEAVWPLWIGRPVPPNWIGGRFGVNLVNTFWPTLADDARTPPAWQWLQFVPLWVLQAVGLGVLMILARRANRLRPPMPTD